MVWGGKTSVFGLGWKDRFKVWGGGHGLDPVAGTTCGLWHSQGLAFIRVLAEWVSFLVILVTKNRWRCLVYLVFFFSSTRAICGWTKSISHQHGTPLIVCWYYKGTIIPGFLRWCEMDFVHPLASPRQATQRAGGKVGLPSVPLCIECVEGSGGVLLLAWGRS